MIDGSTQRCADVCRPPTQAAAGSKREDMKAMKDKTNSPSPFSKGENPSPPPFSRGELKGGLSRRLRVSWWRPSTDRTSVARLCGSVPKRGRPSSRSAMQRSCIANRASKRPLNLFPSPFQGEMQRGSTDAVPRAGRPHVEPTDVYSRPPREGGYSARGARKGESKEGGAFRRPSPADRSPSPFQGEMQRGFARDVQPPTKHAVWRRVPRLVKGASGLTHRSAQRLTPLRGRPLPTTTVIPAASVIPAKPGPYSDTGAGTQRGRAYAPAREEAMEREGTPASVQRPKLRRGPVPTGPKTRPPRSHQMAM